MGISLNNSSGVHCIDSSVGGVWVYYSGGSLSLWRLYKLQRPLLHTYHVEWINNDNTNTTRQCGSHHASPLRVSFASLTLRSNQHRLTYLQGFEDFGWSTVCKKCGLH